MSWSGRLPDVQTKRTKNRKAHTHTYIKNCAFTLQYSYTYIHTLSTPSSPPFSGPNKHYHPSMSAHRLICCLSPCRVSALVRYKATQGNSSLSPKHLVLTVWEGEREGDADRGEMKREERSKNKRAKGKGSTNWGRGIHVERGNGLF